MKTSYLFLFSNSENFESTRKQINRVNKFVKNERFKFENGSLWFRKNPKRNYLIYPSIDEREKIVLDAHNVGHFGIHSTYQKLSRIYFWRNMTNDITNIVNKCAVCLRNNRGKVWNHPAVALAIDGIHDRIHIDLTFGLNETKEGFVGVLVIIESLSDYPWCKPIKS